MLLLIVVRINIENTDIYVPLRLPRPRWAVLQSGQKRNCLPYHLLYKRRTKTLTSLHGYKLTRIIADRIWNTLVFALVGHDFSHWYAVIDWLRKHDTGPVIFPEILT